MEINKLKPEEIQKLNESQKEFYRQFDSFIEGLESEPFDIDKSKYEIFCSRKKCDLVLKIVPKNNLWAEIILYIKPKEIYICLDGWHENIEYQEFSFSKVVENIKKLIIFMLSASCKLIIFKSNNKPYKWSLYGLENGNWKICSSTGPLFYNFFGKKNWEEKQIIIFKEVAYPNELFQE